MENKILREALNECMKQCDALKIPYGNVFTIEASKRVTKRWGCCRYTRFGSLITINKRLLEADVSKMALMDTVMHELLHTCEGCQNHGERWKRYGEMVNKAYGYNIKRCTSTEEKGIAEPIRAAAKYRFMCKHCGSIVTRERASKFTRNPDAYRCGKCGGKFIVL